MTRIYATFDCGIWDDGLFPTLTAGAQRTYFMLVTQKDIAACGSLALTLRRWAKMCADKGLDEWLTELSDFRYLLTDDDSEELLVRTFMKWDGGYRHAKRLLAVKASLLAIRSHSLRSCAVEELAKLGVSIGNPLPPDRGSDATRQAIDPVRSVVTLGEYECTPHSSILGGEPEPIDASVDPPRHCPTHPNGTTRACGACKEARVTWEAWNTDQPKRRLAATARKVAEREACPRCDVDGWVVTDDGTVTTLRCDHKWVS